MKNREQVSRFHYLNLCSSKMKGNMIKLSFLVLLSSLSYESEKILTIYLVTIYLVNNQPINLIFSASTNPDSDDDVNGFEDINGGEIDYIKLAQL